MNYIELSYNDVEQALNIKLLTPSGDFDLFKIKDSEFDNCERFRHFMDSIPYDKVCDGTGLGIRTYSVTQQVAQIVNETIDEIKALRLTEETVFQKMIKFIDRFDGEVTLRRNPYGDGMMQILELSSGGNIELKVHFRPVGKTLTPESAEAVVYKSLLNIWHELDKDSPIAKPVQ